MARLVTQLSVFTALLVLAAPASADEVPLESLAALQRACREARNADRPTLYVVSFGQGQYGFEPYDEDAGTLVVDTRRNLKLYGDHAELFPSELERLRFVASADRARLLRRQE